MVNGMVMQVYDHHYLFFPEAKGSSIWHGTSGSLQMQHQRWSHIISQRHCRLELCRESMFAHHVDQTATILTQLIKSGTAKAGVGDDMMLPLSLV